MPRSRDISRGFNPNRRKPRTCPKCYATTYVTKDSRWYRHRKPSMNFGYDMPNVKGPICSASGCLVAQTAKEGT